VVIHSKVSYIETSHALDEILLNASTGSDNRIDHLMLAQIPSFTPLLPDDLSHSRGNAVAGVSQEYRAAFTLPPSPLDHVGQLFHGQTEVARLDAHCFVGRENGWVVHAQVEVVSFYNGIGDC
jgi:hypothetical protein